MDSVTGHLFTDAFFRRDILQVMASVNLCLADNGFQLRPDKPNGRPLHRLYQLYDLITYSFAFIHNLRESERIVSLQRMELRFL
jgi:hypothetical protein